VTLTCGHLMTSTPGVCDLPHVFESASVSAKRKRGLGAVAAIDRRQNPPSPSCKTVTLYVNGLVARKRFGPSRSRAFGSQAARRGSPRVQKNQGPGSSSSGGSESACHYTVHDCAMRLRGKDRSITIESRRARSRANAACDRLLRFHLRREKREAQVHIDDDRRASRSRAAGVRQNSSVECERSGNSDVEPPQEGSAWTRFGRQRRMVALRRTVDCEPPSPTGERLGSRCVRGRAKQRGSDLLRSGPVGRGRSWRTEDQTPRLSVRFDRLPNAATKILRARALEPPRQDRRTAARSHQCRTGASSSTEPHRNSRPACKVRPCRMLSASGERRQVDGEYVRGAEVAESAALYVGKGDDVRTARGTNRALRIRVPRRNGVR